MNWGKKVLQTLALPLGYGAMLYKNAAYITICRFIKFYIPSHLSRRDIVNFGAEDGIRTRDFDLGKVALYH